MAQQRGLTESEEHQLARELLREGKWPRRVIIKRTLTVYIVNTKRQAAKLLRLLGVDSPRL